MCQAVSQKHVDKGMRQSYAHMRTNSYWPLVLAGEVMEVISAYRDEGVCLVALVTLP